MHWNSRTSPGYLLPIIIFCAATVNLLIVLSGLPLGGLRLLTGAVLVGFAPGYALLLVLHGEPSDLRRQLLISPPLSLALTVIVGSVVSLLGLSLSGHALLVGEWLCVSILLGVYALRVGRACGDGADAGQAARQHVASAAVQNSPWVVVMGIALVALSVTWAASQILPASHPRVTPFTSLAVEQDRSGLRRLVIENHEAEPATYSLTVLADGADIARWEHIQLAPGARQSFVVPATYQQLDVSLYQDGKPEPYRRVWAGVSPHQH